MQQGVVATATIAVKLKMWRSCWRPCGNGDRGLWQVSAGGGGGVCWVIYGAQAAAEATGEADPCLSRSFLFSLPLFSLSAHIHVSSFSWPGFPPSPHLSVWKLCLLFTDDLAVLVEQCRIGCMFLMRQNNVYAFCNSVWKSKWDEWVTPALSWVVEGLKRLTTQIMKKREKQ